MPAPLRPPHSKLTPVHSVHVNLSHCHPVYPCLIVLFRRFHSSRKLCGGDCGHSRVFFQIPTGPNEIASPAMLPASPPSSYAQGRCMAQLDRKSTRLNSSHLGISYAVF